MPHLSGGVKQAGLPSAITAAVYPLALWVGVLRARAALGGLS